MTTKEAPKRDVLLRLIETLLAANVGPTDSMGQLAKDQREVVGED
jgi:hypothetical protein